MWTLTEKGETHEPIPGVPWDDMTDEEFREASREYNERNGFSPQGRYLHRSGFWEHSAGEHLPQEGDDEPEHSPEEGEEVTDGTE